jgi:phenylacetate-CoA ligase
LLARFLFDGASGRKFGKMEPDDLRRLQEKRLRRTVARAYDNSKFWHTWLDQAGVKPGDIQRIEDLRKLPLCDKGYLMPQPIEDRVIGDPKGHVTAPTSGTTGERLYGYWSKAYDDYWASIMYFRMRSLGGVGLFDQMIGLAYTIPRKPGQVRAPWSSLPIERRKAALGTLEPVLSRIGRGVYNLQYLTYGIDEVLPEINRARPEMIWGFTSLVRLLADAVASGKASGLHPKVVLCGGDCLDAASRSYFESTFGCPTLQMYAANEVGFIAQECREKAGMHIMADSMIVEVLRDGEAVAPGEMGEFVVTPLLNDAMPMIRYRLGDVVRATDEACPCGRTTPMLKSVEGRAEDLLVLGEGRMVSSLEIASILKADGTMVCQLVQEELGRFKLLVFSQDQPGVREAAMASVEKLKGILGPEASVDISVVGPREDKKKFRITTSLLKPRLN